jgi:hypothetical protein
VAITTQISILTNSHTFNVTVFGFVLLESETARHHSRLRHSSDDSKTVLSEQFYTKRAKGVNRRSYLYLFMFYLFLGYFRTLSNYNTL